MIKNCEKLQNYRVKYGKKGQILSEVCMIKKESFIVLFTCTSNVMKKVYLKGWFTHHQICCQDLLVSRTQKIQPDFFILASLLDRWVQHVNWLPPRTIAVQLFLVSPTNWFGRLQINLLIFGGRLGYFVWEELVFQA